MYTNVISVMYEQKKELLMTDTCTFICNNSHRAAFKIVAASLDARGAYKIVAASLEATFY